jgi:hypothetical protein
MPTVELQCATTFHNRTGLAPGGPDIVGSPITIPAHLPSYAPDWLVLTPQFLFMQSQGTASIVTPSDSGFQ